MRGIIINRNRSYETGHNIIYERVDSVYYYMEVK